MHACVCVCLSRFSSRCSIPLTHTGSYDYRLVSPSPSPSSSPSPPPSPPPSFGHQHRDHPPPDYLPLPLYCHRSSHTSSHTPDGSHVYYKSLHSLKEKEGGGGGGRHSPAMAVSLALIMMCCVMGTPFSLLLSIPAYILADKVRGKLRLYLATFRSVRVL